MDIDKPLTQYNKDFPLFLDLAKRASIRTNKEISRGIIDVTGKFKPTTLEGFMNTCSIPPNTRGAHIHRTSIIELRRITIATI